MGSVAATPTSREELTAQPWFFGGCDSLVLVSALRSRVMRNAWARLGLHSVGLGFALLAVANIVLAYLILRPLPYGRGWSGFYYLASAGGQLLAAIGVVITASELVSQSREPQGSELG